MRISFVIPTLNEAAYVVESIDRAWDAGADEVLIVDGGSTDGTLALCRFANCQILQSVPGRGRQLNLGAAHSSGEIILFLHADTWLPHDGCDQIRSAVLGQNAVWGAFRQRIEHPSWVYRLLEAGNGLRVRWFKMPYGDQGIFVLRTVFQEIGGFEDLPLMEDFQFSRKMRTQFRFQLMPGPLNVSPRRWDANGPLRQTFCNWAITIGYLCGIDPHRLAQAYHFRKPRRAKPDGRG